jgi:hypothetical protein
MKFVYATDRMMTAAVAIICQNSETLLMTRPSLRPYRLLENQAKPNGDG